MKRIKNFYRKNRVLVILAGIVIVCVIAMGVVLINYFYSGANTSKYGDRLDGIEDVAIADTRISELTLKLKEDKLISEAEIIVTGKIVYSYLTFNQDASLIDAQTKALQMLEEFSEEEKAFYDFHFTLIQSKTDESDGFLIDGAKNVNGTNLVWGNNNVSTETEEDSEK